MTIEEIPDIAHVHPTSWMIGDEDAPASLRFRLSAIAIGVMTEVDKSAVAV